MKLTLQELKDSYSTAWEGIEYAKTFYTEYPKKPTKPHLQSNHSKMELDAYNRDFREYEAALVTYKNKLDEYHKTEREVNDIVEEYIKYLSDFDSVPKQYQDKVYAMAWQEGHSGGYSEVYNCLTSLGDIFIID